MHLQEAIGLSEDISRLEDGEDPLLLHSPILREHGKYPTKETEGEDYIDLGWCICILLPNKQGQNEYRK